jgi:acetyl-CoA hydrolase
MLPTAIADHIESNNLQADPETKKKFNLFVGASVRLHSSHHI